LPSCKSPAFKIIVFDRRAGTFICYVYAITPVASSSLLSTVQDTIDQNVAFPLTGAAVNPDLVGITLATTISMIAGSSQTDRDTAIGQAAAAAQVYLNNLRVGDPLIINDIAAAIRNSSAKILDVGAPNRQIDEIYIWRSRAGLSSKSLYLGKSPGIAVRSTRFFRLAKPPKRHSALHGRHHHLMK
jgi:hypothetical protein